MAAASLLLCSFLKCFFGLLYISYANAVAFTSYNESTEVQTLGVIRIQLIYSINVLSKYSSLVSHRPSIFEDRHINHRSSKVDTSITDLRRSTRRSSIFEGQHIDLRRSTHRSSKVATSTKIEGRNITPTIRHRILSTTALQFLRVDHRYYRHVSSIISMSRRSYARSNVYIYTCIKINNL